jgi:nicotinamide-nucleotide amidase
MKNLNALINKLGTRLKKLKLTLVTAESCTGGGLAYYISRNEKCSAALERGYITYSNHAKKELLGVKSESLQLHGAVSKAVAIEMAAGALQKSCAQISIAITGMAGSDKEEEKDNQGIAWISFAAILDKTHTFKIETPGNREQFMKRIIQESIENLIQFIEKHFIN